MDKEKKKEERRKLSYIPNIQQYFMPVDDSAHYRLLEDANKFVLFEINKLKDSLKNIDKEISNSKKKIKDVSVKIWENFLDENIKY